MKALQLPWVSFANHRKGRRGWGGWEKEKSAPKGGEKKKGPVAKADEKQLERRQAVK